MSRYIAFAVLIAQLCVSAQVAAAQVAAPPDTILFNGKIITVDQNFSYAQAIAVTGGKIAAVGTNAAISKMAGPSTRRIDLAGRTVIPGLMDNHLHAAGGGPGVDLSQTRKLQDVYDAISARVAQSKPGEVIVTNADWHEAQLKEQRLPLRRDLDKVAPNNPLVVVRGGHEYILNTAALKKWEITTATPVPAGGEISRYDDAELNGEVMDRAKGLVKLPERPPKNLDDRIRDQQDEYARLNAAGLTTVRHPGAPIQQIPAFTGDGEARPADHARQFSARDV